jgi:uncharacterized membrane protein
MDDFIIVIYLLFVLFVLVCTFVLPITALVISIRASRRVKRLSNLDDLTADSQQQPLINAHLRNLEARIQRIEGILSTQSPPATEAVLTAPPIDPSIAAAPKREPPKVAVRPLRAIDVESMIGRRGIGWAAVVLILFATAFFLKYAFDNRWIGEVGRVAIGIGFGVTMTALGFKYFKRGWRIFSQILTAGGIVLLYLSTYAAFGYYHLVPQKAAFLFLAIVVAEAAALALLYEAPGIAIMALIGGFLTPLLLHSDRDQYLALFGYIIALDAGALLVLKHWRGLRTLAFIGSHLLFWLWYDQNYHQGKLEAVLLFQTVLFLIFLATYLAARILRRVQTINGEDIWLLLINPFSFFLTVYHLLNPSYHDWMGVFAIVMALIYAGSAKLVLDRTKAIRSESLSLIAVSLTFVTIAIPIQLRSNWITIAWAIEALTMLWAGIEGQSRRLRISACILFGLALGRLLLWDSPYGVRPEFMPVFNRYFLSSLAVIACLFGASALYQNIGKRRNLSERFVKLALLFAAVVALWWVSSVETVTFFQSRAAVQKLAQDARHERWLGQMALSVVWAIYATVLAAVGFVRRSSATRWASLALFALTIVKAMLVDLAELQQLYRIIVFFVLGILLLLVAWGYHKAFQAREAST